MSLREKFIAAYEASELKERDTERKKALIAEIARFFARTKLVSVMINDNPFRIDDLIFYASELSDVDGVYGYEVAASRRCDACKAISIRRLMKDSLKKVDWLKPLKGRTSRLRSSGRWLLEPHLCEFSLEERKPVKGFRRS